MERFGSGKKDYTVQHFCHWKLKICVIIYQLRTKRWLEIAVSHLCEGGVNLELCAKKIIVSLDRTKKKRKETYGVGRDVATSSLVRRIACADIARNVQD